MLGSPSLYLWLGRGSVDVERNQLHSGLLEACYRLTVVVLVGRPQKPSSSFAKYFLHDLIRRERGGRRGQGVGASTRVGDHDVGTECKMGELIK